MAGSRGVVVVLCACLLGEAFAAPAHAVRRRATAVADNEVTSKELTVVEEKSETTTSNVISSPTTEVGRGEPPAPSPDDDDDDDDFADLSPPSSGGGGGSNLFSLLNLVGALFPGSSGNNVKIRKTLRGFILKYQHKLFPKPRARRDTLDNEIEIDYDLKPPTTSTPNTEELNIVKVSKELKPIKNIKPLRQEIEESETEEDNETDEREDDDDDDEEDSKENDAKSVEEVADANGNISNNGDNSKQDDSNEDDYDSDEPPGGGDGQGGGLLGLLAGLSGGEDGQSDLGSLLATVGGIVASLSGDGFDLNAVVASGLGLVVGLLSEGNENPGSIIASYLLTSLDTITGGGADNNGAFFGNFITKLVKGTSAVPQDSSEEDGMMKMPMSDSAGFIASFLTALLGSSSGGKWR